MPFFSFKIADIKFFFLSFPVGFLDLTCVSDHWDNSDNFSVFLSLFFGSLLLSPPEWLIELRIHPPVRFWRRAFFRLCSRPFYVSCFFFSERRESPSITSLSRNICVELLIFGHLFFSVLDYHPDITSFFFPFALHGVACFVPPSFLLRTCF